MSYNDKDGIMLRFWSDSENKAFMSKTGILTEIRHNMGGKSDILCELDVNQFNEVFIHAPKNQHEHIKIAINNDKYPIMGSFWLTLEEITDLVYKARYGS